MAGNDLVLPGTGEVVDLADARRVALALSGIRTLENQLREYKQVLTEALIDESHRQGSQTLDVGDGVKAVVSSGTEVIWDMEILEQLRHVGLPEERFNALVTTEVSYKVNAFEAKRIAAANPAYARIISDAMTTIDKARYVSIRRNT